MNRQEAKELLYQYIQSENLRRHHFAAEAVMRAFARKFNEDENSWGIAGLLHDMDWEQTKDNPDNHTKVAEQILRDHGVDDEVLISAIKAHHPSASGKQPETLMEKTLYYTEELTGLITAAALVRPDKKLGGVTTESLFKKLKDKSFARGIDREKVAQTPEALGLPVEEIIETVLRAMQDIHEDLGL